MSQRGAFPVRCAQRGYALLFAVGAIALIAFGVGRFAARVDLLRAQTQAVQNESEARLKCADARAMVLYWLGTRPIGYAASGFLEEQGLALDGRSYSMPDGALIQVLDDRALLTPNAPNHEQWMSALQALEVSPERARRLIAVLEDYVDEDDLRRLNGAERTDYEELGLPLPRNTWINSLDELDRMPVWVEDPSLLRRLKPWLGLRREKQINPNTAPLPLLQAIFPRISPEQWRAFDVRRRLQPFPSEELAARESGIPFDDKNFTVHAMATLRLRVWAPGMPRSLEYNLVLRPDAPRAPWMVYSSGTAPPLLPTDAQAADIQPFPTPSAAATSANAAVEPAP